MDTSKLADVCLCCCLLMFVCLPLSRHFPCCKETLSLFLVNTKSESFFVVVFIPAVFICLHFRLLCLALI